MNQILTQQNWNGLKVRVKGTPEQPLFIAVDVCKALGLSNSRKATSSLEPSEKITVTNSYSGNAKGIPHQLTAVTESGLYALIFKSRKKEAVKFRLWVCEEVLPAIRKTGRYEASHPLPALALKEVARIMSMREDINALRRKEKARRRALAQKLKKAGWTYAKIQRETGYDNRTIWAVLKGIDHRASVLMKLAMLTAPSNQELINN